ncbi:MAG: hypothetical protein M3548_23600 [Actinomycetota bacterium]|nr:hypothetical protein [Actinomycetota bacterium]
MIVVAAVAGLMLGTAACSASAPEISDTTKIDWVGRVCSAVAGTPVLAAVPAIDPVDPMTVKAELSAYLGTAVTGVTRVVDALSAVGASPVDGGDLVVGSATEFYSRLRTEFDAAKSTLDGTDDPAVIAEVIADTAARTATLVDPLPGVADSEFADWARQARACVTVYPR